jgi:transposase InsO family protein
VSLLQPLLARRDDGTPDRCWKNDGVYYVNRADPALFVEKRVGIGYTPNFGNPWSWVVLIIFTFASMAPVILPFEHLRIHSVEAQLSLKRFRRTYNFERPHQALRYRVPADLFCTKSADSA